jgi:3',5'-cyclic AMP phosphodiesterase CpdA
MSGVVLEALGPTPEWPQLRILHLSDLHFGEKHISRPEFRDGATAGIPKLAELLIDDLKVVVQESEWSGVVDPDLRKIESQIPVILVVSGDLTQVASRPEFEEALSFLSRLTETDVLGRPIGRDWTFVVPGNHDVVFSQADANTRFQQYCSFYNEFFDGVRPAALPHRPIDLSRVHVRKEAGVVLAEVNCCMYVQKDTPDQSRGQIDPASIASLETQLEALDGATLAQCFRIAMLHHHPVLLPAFIEPGRGIDAVLNARSLLSLLRQYQFHLVLHGHKHFPQVFSYDPDSVWAPSADSLPQLIVAGGSCGSQELPGGTAACNTYNMITAKWLPESQQARVRVVTRGLQRTGRAGPLDPHHWKWRTLGVIDRSLSPFRTVPNPVAPKVSHGVDPAAERKRRETYEALRYYLPVVDVSPSLAPGQEYEARAWIVRHERPDGVASYDPPVKVVWSAGKFFAVQTCLRTVDTNFCASFHYWGPMLLQAQLHFADGYVAEGHVYARLPIRYG